MDTVDILVDNLREALRQIQRSVVFGLVASLSLMLLQLSTVTPGTAQPIQLPGLVVAVDSSIAKILLIVAHIVAGFMALASLEDARRVARSIKDRPVRDAALLYPNAVTNSDPMLRFPACLAPPLFFMVAVVAWELAQPEREWFHVIGAFSFGAIPYVAVAYRAKELIPAVEDASA